MPAVLASRLLSIVPCLAVMRSHFVRIADVHDMRLVLVSRLLATLNGGMMDVETAKEMGEKNEVLPLPLRDVAGALLVLLTPLNHKQIKIVPRTALRVW